MKKVFLLVMMFVVSTFAMSQPLIITATADVQSVSTSINYDMTLSGLNAPWSLSLYYQEGTNPSWATSFPQTIIQNVGSWGYPICTDSSTVKVFYRMNNIQTGGVFYSDTLTLTLLIIANESPWAANMTFRTFEKNVICGSSGISSKVVNVGDSARITFLSFKEYSQSSSVDSIRITVNGQTWGEIDFVGPGSQNGLWVYKMSIDTNRIIIPNDTIVTWAKRSSINQWVTLEVDVTVGSVVEVSDQWVNFSSCAPLSRIQFKNCNSGGNDNYIEFTLPPTAPLNDTVCINVDMTFDEQATINFGGMLQGTFSITGDTSLCFPVTNCDGNTMYINWNSSNGSYGDTILSTQIVLPYNLAITAGATNASVSITGMGGSPLLFRISDDFGIGVDSMVTSTDTVWNIFGLSPNHIFYSIIGVIPNNCYGQGFFTDQCGSIALGTILSTDSVDVEVIFPLYMSGSIAWLNGTPILLDATTSNMGIGSFIVTIPITSLLTLLGPCGDQHTATVVGSEEETVTLSLRVFPNPTQGIVSIDNLPRNATITVTDALGRNVWIGHSTTIDLSSKAAGFYSLRVSSSQGATTFRVVKQ